MSTVLEARGLVRRYPGDGSPVRAVDGVDLVVEAGEAVSVMGPSGCGKSTLLRIVAGLRPATVGTVTVEGRTVTKPIADIGMVFQAPILLKWRTILDNILLPAELAGKEKRAYTRATTAQLMLGSRS